MSFDKPASADNQPKLNLSSPARRDILKGLAAATVVSAIPDSGAATELVSIDRFLKVSSLVTGIPLDKTYTQLAEIIWDAILRMEDDAGKAEWGDVILRLEDLKDDTSEEQMLSALGGQLIAKARELARIWYTGTIIRKDKSKLILTYDDALVWRACDWTKPAATCGGKFGYWAHPFRGKV